MAIPTKVEERISKNLSKFQNVLKRAKDKDLNESDTVQIISDILADVFGYDKYSEVTSELAIRGTFCDLAIKINDKFQFLIECKAIGIQLKDNHLKQAIDYGANKGIPWIVLTNGTDWEIYKIKFEKPISYDLVCAFNLIALSSKKDDDLEKLFILCKEGLSKDHRENFYEKTQCVNKFIIGSFILSEPVISRIKKELRSFSDGLKIENEEIESIIKQEILRREIIEGDDAEKNFSRIKRYYKKLNRQENTKITQKETSKSEIVATADDDDAKQQIN